MLPTDPPSRDELTALASLRADACVSIYVETTPVTGEIAPSRIGFANAVRAAQAQLEAAGLDKRRLLALTEQLDDLDDDAAFWARQARTLCVLATPDRLRTFRLANRVAPTLQVSDRFHLKPLLRAATHRNDGFVLALSEGGARLVETFADAPALEIRVAEMPRDAASAVGKASLNDRSHSQRIVGAEGKKVRLRQYARAVDAAVRAALPPEAGPIVLASNPPLDEIYRSVASLPSLLTEGFSGEIDRLGPHELAESARGVFDRARAAEIAALRDLIARREGQGRATTDLAVAARAAAMGAVETLLVDMDRVTPGTVDETTGAVAFAAAPGADSYGVEDAISMAALATGARVVAGRAADLPEGAAIAATLRFAL